MKIWLPDNQTATVEWYVTNEKRAVGVNEIRDEWAAHEIRPRPAGFWVEDPDREDELPQFRP